MALAGRRPHQQENRENSGSAILSSAPTYGKRRSRKSCDPCVVSLWSNILISSSNPTIMIGIARGRATAMTESAIDESTQMSTIVMMSLKKHYKAFLSSIRAAVNIFAINLVSIVVVNHGIGKLKHVFMLIVNTLQIAHKASLS
mmetsp:Transcript_13652/g.28200  ORF Transcript_13652/g.28200 Transcript_13652/m.28200 type:complete len:144 (-) Transcript_13652:1787-2218(-)